MIIKLIWLACSLIVFKHVITYAIKEEVRVWGEIDGGTLFLLGMIALLVSTSGPIAIIGYLFYNILEGIAQAITEGSKKPKDDKWRYPSEPR